MLDRNAWMITLLLSILDFHICSELQTDWIEVKHVQRQRIYLKIYIMALIKMTKINIVLRYMYVCRISAIDLIFILVCVLLFLVSTKEYILCIR